MVRILASGDIVPDDDPRAQQQAPQQARLRAPPSGDAAPPPGAAPPGAAARAPLGGGRGFSLDAPPFEVRPAAGGGALPDFLVFGIHIPGAHALLLAGAGLALGWRALLLGAALIAWRGGVFDVLAGGAAPAGVIGQRGGAPGGASIGSGGSAAAPGGGGAGGAGSGGVGRAAEARGDGGGGGKAGGQPFSGRGYTLARD